MTHQSSFQLQSGQTPKRSRGSRYARAGSLRLGRWVSAEGRRTGAQGERAAVFQSLSRTFSSAARGRKASELQEPDLVRLSQLLSKAPTTEDASFAGEFSAIMSWVHRCGVDLSYVVDIGASDGLSQSSSFPIVWRDKVQATLVEADLFKVFFLAGLYRNHENVNIAHCRITPHNVASALQVFEVPQQPSVLSVDIDSWDLAVVRAIIDSGISPQIISLEVNKKIPAGILFETLYRSDHVWNSDHFYGCSISSAHEALASRGYSLVQLEWNNAIFVRSDCVDAGLEQDPEDAYQLGYAARESRRHLFPWNADVDHWLRLSQESAVVEINRILPSTREAICSKPPTGRIA